MKPAAVFETVAGFVFGVSRAFRRSRLTCRPPPHTVTVGSRICRTTPGPALTRGDPLVIAVAPSLLSSRPRRPDRCGACAPSQWGMTFESYRDRIVVVPEVGARYAVSDRFYVGFDPVSLPILAGGMMTSVSYRTMVYGGVVVFLMGRPPRGRPGPGWPRIPASSRAWRA